jgi:hypothetical protein
MTPAEFLRVVLPSPGFGHYCIFSAQRKEHFFGRRWPIWSR